ncbi:hypothetical protein [Sphingobium yanoikuyae]|uniref:hypothetical protein n=1 Tax=Sphingobium yanoikuyae TaxID=13690 RepID=UPI00242AFFA8|nr:hypothetical protein [Sphingobium yanoikuyae]
MGDANFFWLVTRAVLACYGALYLVTSITSPAWFLEKLAWNRPHFGTGKKGVPWLRGGAAMLGVGVLLYAAAYAIAAAIPFDMGSVSEDGDWSSTREVVQAGIALFGTITLMTNLEKNARVLVWGPIELRARLALCKTMVGIPGVPAGAVEGLDATLVRTLYEEVPTDTPFSTAVADDVRADIVSRFEHGEKVKQARARLGA